MSRGFDLHAAEVSFSATLGFADFVVDGFYRNDWDLWDNFCDDKKLEIMPRLYRPHQWNVLHVWLKYCHDIYVNIMHWESSAKGYPIYVKKHYKRKIMADTQKNDWEDAEKFFIHSTFHLLFYNRRFLKEFNLKLAEHVRDNITDLIADTTYQSYFTNGKFKRNTDYRWVKDGIFSRENYRCPLCSCDLSVRNKSKKPNLDHIVSIYNFGSNNPTNLQYLRHVDNGEKCTGNDTNNEYVFIWDLKE